MLRFASGPVGRLLGRMGHPHSLVAPPASSVGSYLIALLLGVLALAIRGLLGSVTDLVFVTLYPAVLAAAWWCGLGPALLTTAVCALGGDFYSMLPRQQTPFDRRVLTNVTLFIALSIFGAVLTAKFRNGQRQLASVLDAMGDGVLTLDRQWRFTYVNRRYTELVSRDAAALLGGVLWELFPGADARPIGQALRRAMADGSPANVVALSPALHKWIEGDIYPTPQGLTVFVRDVTGRVEAEHQRAVELAALQNARMEMERISRLKDEFLATVSHELRTPLNAVAGWSQVLAHGTALPPDAAAATQRIQRSAALLTKLVDDLLDVARVATGKLHFSMARVDMTRVLEHALDNARVAADGKGLSIGVTSCAGPLWIRGDAARLQQAIGNLLSNAVKFTPEGGTVYVGLRREGREAKLEVRDTGAGIAPAFLPRVFEHFSQSDDMNAAALGGLGLGLSIVRHVIEAHRGTVTAASDGPHRGATFTVTLPVESTLDHVMVPGGS
jgi:signal transduction histidine kinase